MEKAEQTILHDEGSVISIILPTRGRTDGALQDSIEES